MKVVVFAHNLHVGGGRSVGVNLILTLPQVGCDVEFLVVVPAGEDYRQAADNKNVTVIELPKMGWMRRMAWELWEAPRLSNSFRADWILSLTGIPIMAKGARSAVLMHDPNIFYPRHSLRVHDWPTRVRKAVLRGYMRLVLDRVDLVLAQTHSAAARIKSTYGVQSVIVVPNAVSLRIRNRGQAPHVIELPEAEFRFLALTRYYPHKNLEVLVDLVSRFRDELEGVIGILTVTPEDHPRARRLLSKIREEGLSNKLINIGWVPQASLAQLYAEVDAIVLPTLLESFSSTYIEAMKFEVPILTSDRDFARDVCGDAALYFEPMDARSILSALQKVRRNTSLRERLITRGKEQLVSLEADWHHVSSQLLSVLDSNG